MPLFHTQIAMLAGQEKGLGCFAGLLLPERTGIRHAAVAAVRLTSPQTEAGLLSLPIAREFDDQKCLSLHGSNWKFVVKKTLIKFVGPVIAKR